MNEYNERVLKTVLQDYRAENDEELLKEIEEAKNDPFFQVSDEEAKAFALKYVKKQKKNNRTFLKAACFIAAIILAGVSLIPITVQGKKSTIVQHLIYCISSEFLSFGTDDENSLLLSYKGEFVPSYIPEGYYVESVNNEKKVKELTLKNDNGKMIIFSEKIADAKNNVDHQDGIETEKINLLGYNGIYYKKGDTQFIVVITDDSVFSIICNDDDISLSDFKDLIEKK